MEKLTVAEKSARIVKPFRKIPALSCETGRNEGWKNLFHWSKRRRRPSSRPTTASGTCATREPSQGGSTGSSATGAATSDAERGLKGHIERRKFDPPKEELELWTTETREHVIWTLTEAARLDALAIPEIQKAVAAVRHCE